MDVLTKTCFLSLFVGQVLAYSQLVPPKTIAVGSSTYGNYVASLAVDGNTDQDVSRCFHSDVRTDIKEAWLRIDLGGVHSVKSVKFWYRGDRKPTRLRGHSIRVSNDTNVPPVESSCYTAPENVILPEIVEEDCEKTARYIWIYQNNNPDGDKSPIVTICEVKIFGCNPGYFGDDCSKKCDHCENNATCGANTGECDALGCSDKRYQPRFCTTCEGRSYGVNCRDKCGHCLNNSTCHFENGTCLKGCAAGFRTHKCQTPCNEGTYGANCSFNCSGNCFDGKACDKVNGNCRSCAVGYQGLKCEKNCDARKYGKACSESCGACLHSTICNHITGDCGLGCEPGWQKTAQCKTGNYLIVTTCKNGTFGLNCKYNCSGNCQDEEPCNSTDGTCASCSPGWDTLWCNKTCDATWFGAGCKFQCGHCIGEDNCHHVNGSCLLGCQKGFTGDLCFNRTQRIEVTPPDTLDLTVVLLIVCPVAGLLFIALCVVTMVFLSRNIFYDASHRHGKQKNKRTDEKFHKIEEQDNEDEESPETLDDTILYTTVQIRSKSIKTADLLSVIKSMGDDTDKGFTEEFNNTDGDAVYIASQGPKPKTVGDFWKMIWQENVFVIAMVTNLKEGDKTQETRQITHLQYTSWPDHGTPNPLELLSFYHYVSRAMEQHPEQKLVVHCSAGIGRTGTFIALDALHREGVKKGKINIVEYVHTMREDRMNMIQNTNQYKFLYHALYESFRTGCHVLKKDVFVQEMDAQMQSDKATNLSNFRTEFKELDSMRRIFDENEKQIGIQNLKLNMTENVLPADKMRIILSSHVPERGTYYNAVPISTFTTKDCIIAGQYPVQGAGIDLIRLLVDQDCSSLVLTHPLSEIPHSGGWFSDPSFNYRVEVGAVTKMSADVNKCNVRIKPPSSKGWHKVSMYEIKTWNPTENLPQVLLDAVKRIQLCELVDPERKLAILSRDGASRCGEFCAVYNAIQQLQQDQEVDMFTIVRQLQSRRPEMISDLNEYLLCCQAVAEFIKSDSEDTYMNSATSSAGRYGRNCYYTCSGNYVNGEACDKTNGSCRSSVDGFLGFKCDREGKGVGGTKKFNVDAPGHSPPASTTGNKLDPLMRLSTAFLHNKG
uniref:protein-tyrosine-phosphatase n=1 Tax=Magallana gigas TaxID=29159 RepID=K1QG63_MAGGI